VELTYDFENQIPALIAHVSGVQEILERRVHIKPAVRIAVCFVPYSVRFLANRRVHNGARYGNALLLHDEALRVIDVIP
jgi:hypothetical protein